MVLNKKLKRLIGRVLLIIGCFFCAYPMVSNAIYKRKQQDVLAQYQKAVCSMKRSEKESCIENSILYNERLVEGLSSSKQYEMLLNPTVNGMMGIIEIPKLQIRLPIYHGTGNEQLKEGVGHIEGSSLPIGGKNTHCLLAGHRGTPKQELFLKLGELNKGDVFCIDVMEQRLFYKVCEIQVIQPTYTECLNIQKGKDLVSLVTCTPYGINTHRLIVTGERMEVK